MKHNEEIKGLLEKYYEGISTDEDEQFLYVYFSSDEIAEEFEAYRSIFIYLKQKRSIKDDRQLPVYIPSFKKRIIRYIIPGAAAACILLAAGLYLNQKHEDVSCSGTFVMIDGVCSDDLSLVKKYTIQTIDRITSPTEKVYDPLDFLDEEIQSY
ncbi:MAG: hypothetical protein LBQ60_02220 [Bacteroidales bacterium]|jgi:hypothetical protein|nr:hypothetical protein [Bacteroidales bacterium]